ncbi:MAG: rhodanese-like domain-containing protein [Nitrospirota bacterium]
MKQVGYFIFSILVTFLSVTGTAGLEAVYAAETLPPEDVRSWQESNTSFLLVDVRARQLFTVKHIAGAINVPSFVIAKKGLPRDEKIVLYDSGIGSLEARDAAQKLSDAGYPSIYLLDGGLSRWEVLGFPLVMQVGVVDSRLVHSISAVELAQAMREGAAPLLIDLRTRELFAAGTIPGAMNVSPERLGSVVQGMAKDSLIVFFDGGNGIAGRQAEIMHNAGFKVARYLFGGFAAWQRMSK